MNKQQCLLSLLSTLALLAFVGLALATTVVPHQAAFIQSGDELRYFVDDEQAVFVSHLKNVNSRESDDTRSPSAAPRDDRLEFDPAKLDMGRRSFGGAHIETVRVRNPTKHVVRFDAISGTSHHFHASFFAEKTLAPGGTTTFDVAFLPRAVANMRSTLYINSSLGQAAYEVSGSGVLSAYDIVSHMTARTCVNGSVVAPVSITNPYERPLHITEMYTSSVDVHLELPTVPIGGTVTGDALSTWNIPPHATTTVMHARYMGAIEQNTTAYIRIKAREEGGDRLQWVLPFDAHVSRRKGIYAVTPLLDFGIVRNLETSKAVDLHIAANTNKTVFITDISAESHEPAIRIVNPPKATDVVGDEEDGRQWTATLDGKCASCPVLVAKINLLGAQIRATSKERIRHLSGRIVVEGRHKGGGKYRLAVWYGGELLHEPAETSFHSGKETPLIRNVTLRNTFDRPITIREVSLSKVASRFFATVAAVPLPLVLYPHGGASVAFALQYHTRGPSQFLGTVRLQTNMSAFDIALHIFDGKLQFSLSSIEQNVFDFGTLEAGDARSILLTVANPNTVPVGIRQHRHAIQAYTSVRVVSTHMYNDTVGEWSGGYSWSSHMRHLHTAVNEYVAMAQGDGGSVHSEWVSGQDVVIPASSVTVFEYTLVAPETHAKPHAVHTFQTPYEEKSYAVHYRVEPGTMVSIPETIVLPNAYPYRMSTAPLHVYSTFPRNMTVKRLSTLTHDSRFVFETFEKQAVGTDPKRHRHVNSIEDIISPVVSPNVMSYLGRLFFVPHRTCKDQCYVGTPLTEDEGKWFAYGMRLPANLAQIDAYVHNKLRQRWRKFTKASGNNEEDGTHDSSDYVVRSHVVVDTDTVKNMRIPVEAQLVWPKIMTRHTVHFPLTAVGNFSIVNLTMHNPSTRPILVQLLPLTIYPDPELFLHYFDEHMPSVLSSNVEMNETLMFTLRDTELFPLRPDSPVPRLREEIESVVNHQMPRFTLSMILQPGMKVRVRVGFMPRDFEMRSSLIIIRNNLTGIEPVVLHGRGAKVEMLLDRHPSRHDRAISFDLGDELLADCATPPIRLTVRRLLTVWNTGQVHMHVTNLSVNGVPCVNRGYRILNCEPFKLRPNDTHDLSIAYTPDFLLSSGDAAIQLFAMHNSTPWTYFVGSAVPEQYLTSCHLALPRPPWESLLYWMTFIFITMTFVCTWASAFLEGDRFVTVAYRQMKDMFDEERAHFTPFDLNRRTPSNAALTHNGVKAAEEAGVVPAVVKSVRWTLLRALDAVLIRIRAALTEEENEARPPPRPTVVAQQPIAVVEPQPPVVPQPAPVAPSKPPPIDDTPPPPPQPTKRERQLALKQQQQEQRRLQRQREAEAKQREEERRAKREEEQQSDDVGNEQVEETASDEMWEVIDRRPNKATKERRTPPPPTVEETPPTVIEQPIVAPSPVITPTLAPPPGLHAPVTVSSSTPSSVESVPEWDNDDDVLSVNDDAMDVMASAALHFDATLMHNLSGTPSRDASVGSSVVEKTVESTPTASRSRRKSNRGKKTGAAERLSAVVPTLASTAVYRPPTAAQQKQYLAQQLYQQRLLAREQRPPGYGSLMPQTIVPPYQQPNGDWPATEAGQRAVDWMKSGTRAPGDNKPTTFKFNRDAPPFVAKTITPPMKPIAPIGRAVDDPSVLMSFPPRGISPPPLDRAPILDTDRSGWLSMSGGLFNLSNIWQPKLGLEPTGDDWAAHGFTATNDDEHDDGGEHDDEGDDGDDGDATDDEK